MVSLHPPFIILTGLERGNVEIEISAVSCIQGVDNYVWLFDVIK